VNKLILFGVCGFERGRGGSGGLGVVVEADGRRRHVQTSRSIMFCDPVGHTITSSCLAGPRRRGRRRAGRPRGPLQTPAFASGAGTSDYWALHSVEEDHVRSLAHRYVLSDQDQAAVRAHWMARVEAELADTNERLRFKDMDAASNSRIARRLMGRNLLYNLWSNTLGPGAKCWFGNRHTPIRHYTFRLRWRP
jgi:hypothetical protein